MRQWRLTRRSAALALLLLVAACTPVGLARAQDIGQIVFHSTVDGNTDIYVMNEDGADIRRLTDHPDRDVSPRWSPGGTLIAFISGRANDGGWHVYVMDADGRNVERVTEEPTDGTGPSWSPDSSLLAFLSSWLEPVAGLYTVRIDGTGIRKLTDPPDSADPTNHFQYTPDWSPDGRTILINAHGNADDGKIWAMSATGQGLARKLSNDDGEDLCLDWSPDGQSILFKRHVGKLQGVYTMDPDGQNVAELIPLILENIGCPRWSPSGAQFVFMMDSDIHVADVDGNRVRRLVELPETQSAPDWFDPAFARTVAAAEKRASHWAALKRSRVSDPH